MDTSFSYIFISLYMLLIFLRYFRVDTGGNPPAKSWEPLSFFPFANISFQRHMNIIIDLISFFFISKDIRLLGVIYYLHSTEFSLYFQYHFPSSSFFFCQFDVRRLAILCNIHSPGSSQLSFNSFFCAGLGSTWTAPPFSSIIYFFFYFFLYFKHLRWVQVVCTCQRHLQPLSSFDYNTPTTTFFLLSPFYYTLINTWADENCMCLCIYLFFLYV